MANTDTLKTRTAADLKAWARANRGIAEAVCAARAFAQLERERVAAYIAPVFARYTFADDHTGEVITDPERLYLSDDDELCAEYFAACDVAHRENGFTGPEGYCPALMAESLARKAEHVLLAQVADFGGLDAGRLTLNLKIHAEALEWGLRVALGDVK